MAVCDEDNVGIVGRTANVVGVTVDYFLLVNADTAVFVYGYEIKHGEISLSVFFYNYSIDRRG